MSVTVPEIVPVMLAARSSVRETQRIIRERSYPASQLADVLFMARESHITGTVMIDLTQGAIGTVRLREEHPVSP